MCRSAASFACSAAAIRRRPYLRAVAAVFDAYLGVGPQPGGAQAGRDIGRAAMRHGLDRIDAQPQRERFEALDQRIGDHVPVGQLEGNDLLCGQHAADA